MNGEDAATEKSHPTIIRSLLDSDLPENEKSFESLQQKAQVIVMAGSITVARALEVATYYLLTMPELEAKLQEELRAVKAGPQEVIPLRTLEQLPYLVRYCSKMHS
jgi:cytochrome P450